MRNLGAIRTATAILVALATLWPSGALASPAQASVVIAVEHVGGFVAPSFRNARLPDVVLYSDGRVLAARNIDGAVKEMFQGSINPALLHSELAAFMRAAKTPSGGWGLPGVSDIPSTQISITHDGKRELAVVYALGFTSNLSKEAVAARSYLAKTIEKLVSLAGKNRVYRPTSYELWPAWPSSIGTPPGSPTTNPAALFCLSQYGTLVAGKVLLDSPTPASDISTEFCHLPDGSFVEEWKYFYQIGKSGIPWPSQITAPIGICQSVAAKPVASLLRTAGVKEWLLPSGAMINLTWRPVLPGEIACKR